ncbi:ribonuclease R [Paramaledivibacter caminithermalis]|uniref:Ribonuclease R n=1 Tax=Paramaledivibacter caminithermalis (strain DSM 15212 / CIP 107654 / DViRD3) TaxID=1121301 RepID=A0A1M6R6C2_PARC5|nr:ribonuclease R [Paramaledivibacter caminithermalis]SHK28002.1 RNAse R [Paramaledivibacter caminithermalis DSM 15212]
MVSKEILLEFMREQAYNPMSDSELANVFDIKSEEMGYFLDLLKEMEEYGQVIKTKKKRYAIPERMNLIVGRLQCSQKGFGFVIPDNNKLSDVFIPASDLNGAMHNDRVIARIERKIKNGKRAEGVVIRILDRANKEIVGTFENSKNFGFVVADDKRINFDVFIPKSEVNGAKDGYKVVVQITKWPEARRNPEGKIVEVLGHKNDVGSDILSIIRKYKLPEKFPKKVLREADNIPDKVSEDEIARRRDLRHMNIVTIDGADAKDLDDAVSVEKLPNGNYRLGVYIADVTYYVKEGSPLDKEALKRGTSVYLVDRVIPMLPKKLSNGICSLNPGVDRLTMSVFMEIDNSGKVVNHEIFEGVIKTKERMTYTEVSDILEKEDPKLIERYDYLVEDFKLMEELALILSKSKNRRGSIDFDFPESKIILDDDGRPIDIRKAERRIANRIIEEFMIVCNETIAQHMYWLKIPFVYRVHEIPDSEKIANFNKFIHNFGYHLKGSSEEVHPKALQDLLRKIEGKKEEHIISTLMLRSLKQARYSPENLGHFGLASNYYCHFTSPIRRYPDLQIHRIIREMLNGKLNQNRISKLKGIVANSADRSSERERVAVEAERETEDLKKAEYMSYHIGEEFDGIISSVVSFGMFVELENTIEGLVRISTLVDDYYIFDEENHLFRGERTNRTFRIGDEVRIKVYGVDIAQREVDFILI